MLCAAELLTLRKEAEKEYQEEQIKLDVKCALEFVEAVKNTYKLCEDIINQDLQAKARERMDLKVEYLIVKAKDRLGNELFKMVRPERRRYANGKVSLSPSGDFYSVKELENFLASHCYKISYKETTYKNYGLGTCYCEKMIISI